MGKLDNKKVAIIGVGHMGKSLMTGLLSAGLSKEDIALSDKFAHNKAAVVSSDWIIFAVKPSKIREVTEEIKDEISTKLVISAAAAVSTASIEKYAGNKSQKVIRIMPNIAAAYNQSTIGIYANKNVSKVEKVDVINLLSRLGKVFELKREKDIDVFTVIAACSPAVIAYFSKILSEYGVRHGLSLGQSEKIVNRAFQGTSIYQEKSALTSTQLIQSVATKGGVTENIIRDLDDKKISVQITESLERGYLKIKNTEKELKKSYEIL